MLSACIALGTKLHLFDALAKVGSESSPATAAQVADESGCKERYVKEWLAAMATADIISVTEDEKFFIKKENISVLTSTMAVMANSLLPNFLKPYDKLCQVIKKDGPLGLDYSDYTAECFDVIAKLSEAAHIDHLIPHIIPALGEDVKKRLEEGGLTCLDIGCGKGIHAFRLGMF
ncbi:unnamed protein product [Cylicostephanus goldi]|uniref:S-adenosylmethionine-dependent methyltransferase Rv2258c-like winged HTH domain-containing protein n=1 Tax=Cylicostephanus goldi TaxID=71465 RepID=A0A3P7Q8W4_CYLGO|nr:unnamed protein product [Cylicostephanus goldi]